MIPSRLSLPFALALLAIACSSAKRENIQPPKELEDFTPTLSVERLWSRGIGDVGGKPGLAMSAAFADGQLYVANSKGVITVLDAGSGSEVNRFDTDQSLSSTPGVGEGAIAVGTIDGRLLVYGTDGSERWSAQLSSEVISAPLIAGGRVYARSHDGRIYAYSLDDGSRLWVQERTVPPLSLRGNGTLRYARGYVLAGNDDGRLVALRSDDGTSVWEQQVGLAEGRTDLERLSDLDGELAVSEDIIYAVGYDGQAMAVDIASGGPLWARDMSAITGVADGEHLFVSDTDGKVWALDRRSGGSLWSQDAFERRQLSTPAAVDGHVAVGDLDGYVHWLRADDGSLAAREHVAGDAIRAAPIAIGNTVYVMTIGGTLAAYRVGG